MKIKKILLYEMTWREAQDALQEINVAIIPVGSSEQHGPHLPIGTDSMIAYEVARRTAQILGAIVTPVIPYGRCEHHMKFPGTITLRMETFQNLVKDVAKSLVAHGIKNIVILNGHGGNVISLAEVGKQLKEETGINVFISNCWDVADQVVSEIAGRPIPSLPESYSGWMGHGGEMEVVGIMALRPELVDLDKVSGTISAEPYLKSISPALSESMDADFWKKSFEEGWFGSIDMRYTTPEQGEKMYDLTAKRLAELIRQRLSKR